MRRLFAALAATFIGVSFPGCGQAAVVVCTGNNCATTNENVTINSASNVTSITGQGVNSNVGVLFTSSTDRLNGNANGQADISAVDNLLNSLTFSLAGGATFGSATFNLFPLPGNAANEAVQVLLSYTGGSQLQTIGTNGQNFIGISGTAGERFTSVTFLANPASTGIQDFRQLRLGGVSVGVVPEPSTWLTMLAGMALVGTVHRRRRRGGAVTTIAA